MTTRALLVDDHADTPTVIAARTHRHTVAPRSRDAARVESADEGAAARLLDLIARRRPAWHAQAACRGQVGTFFADTTDPDYRTKLAAARAICSTCPVAAECAEEAARWPAAGLHGVWAGTTATQRINAARTASTSHPPGWLTLAQAARRTGRSKTTLLKWTRSGDLAAQRHRGRVYVDPDALDRLHATRRRPKRRLAAA